MLQFSGDPPDVKAVSLLRAHDIDEPCRLHELDHHLDAPAHLSLKQGSDRDVLAAIATTLTPVVVTHGRAIRQGSLDQPIKGVTLSATTSVPATPRRRGLSPPSRTSARSDW